MAQWIQERIGLQGNQARVTHPHRRFEPLQRLDAIAPLRVNLGILVRGGIAISHLRSRDHGQRVGAPTELVIDHRQAYLTLKVVPVGLARGKCAAQVAGRVESQPERPVPRLVVGIDADGFPEDRDGFLISPGAKEGVSKTLIGKVIERVQNHGAAPLRDSLLEVPHVGGKAAYALDLIAGPNGQAQCRVTAQNPGSTNPYIKNCVPFDPFGVGNNSLAAINYVTADFGNTALNWQDDAQANIQAPVVTLPAGAARASLGLESRYEYASFNPDTASAQGLGYFVPVAQTHGDFSTHEAYGELNVPLIGDNFSWPFAHTLDVDGAYRHVDSALAGSNNAWNYGLVFAPTQDVGFRFGRASTYREPSLQEAFSPPTNAFDDGIDPCQASNIDSGPNPAARERNCATAFAALGANLPEFTSSNVEQYTIPVTSGGNADLKNEIAHSLNLGIVVTPRWVPGLSVTADYIQVIVTDAIEYAGVANLMEECYDSPTYPTSTCADFTREAGTGQVVSANETFINEGYNHLRLIQYKVDYVHSLQGFPGLGRFHNPGGISFTTNIVDMRENNGSISGKGFDTIESANTATTVSGDFPRWSINGDLGYHRDAWQAHWQTFYQSRMYFDLTYTAANQLPLSIPSSTTHELDVLYNVNKHVQLGAHVFNVFDKAPPQPWTGYPVTGLGRLFELTGRLIF